MPNMPSNVAKNVAISLFTTTNFKLIFTKIFQLSDMVLSAPSRHVSILFGLKSKISDFFKFLYLSDKKKQEKCIPPHERNLENFDFTSSRTKKQPEVTSGNTVTVDDGSDCCFVAAKSMLGNSTSITGIFSVTISACSACLACS